MHTMSEAAMTTLTNIVAANISTATCVVVPVVAVTTGAVSGDIRRASSSSHDGTCMTQPTTFQYFIAAAAYYTGHCYIDSSNSTAATPQEPSTSEQHATVLKVPDSEVTQRSTEQHSELPPVSQL